MTLSKTLKTGALLSLATLFIAGCTPKSTSETPTEPSMVKEETKIDTANTAAKMTTAPTVSASTKTSDIEKEVNDTTIENEDFSDIK